MRGAEFRGSSSALSLSFAVRATVIAMRRNNQVVSMENAHEEELCELDLFQSHVADRLRALLASDGGDKGDKAAAGQEEQQRQQEHHQPLITLSFLQKLLEAFLCIEEEFRALLPLLLARETPLASRPPPDRLVADLLDRYVKSLDVCNAVTQALDSLHSCRNHAEIAASALCPLSAAVPSVGEAQFHRARRALSKLLALFPTSDSSSHHGPTTERAWSFGRSSRGGAASSGSSSAAGYGRRCLVLNVSPNWSAAKQMQAMWASLAPPRGADATALATAVYTMSAVTVLVTWALVAAFPCRERGGQGSSAVAAAATSSPPPPRQLPWAAPMVALQERIADEWRRDRKGLPGLLAELQSMVRCGRTVVDLGGGAPGFPLEEWQWEEVAGVCSELAATCRSMEVELGPLQRQVREVFHRVVHSRAEALDRLSHGE